MCVCMHCTFLWDLKALGNHQFLSFFLLRSVERCFETSEIVMTTVLLIHRHFLINYTVTASNVTVENNCSVKQGGKIWLS